MLYTGTSINVYILIGVGSSVLVLLLSLAAFVVSVCYFKQRQTQKTINNSLNGFPHSQDNNASILYEDIPPKTVNCQETESDIDFETNVAYSSVKIRP